MKTWNYKKPDDYVFISQKVWNQTIVTVINCIVAENNIKLPCEIYSPIKFKKLFESLTYYNVSNDTIGNKYIIKYGTGNVENTILINSEVELEILNFIVNDIVYDSDLETDVNNLDKLQSDSDIEMVINYHIIDRDAKINDFVKAIKSRTCSEDYLIKDLKYIISMNNSISVLNKAIDILTYIKE